ncbi:hypothetical protein QFZ82_003994 [Streptomyces sp. V4I23]|uniref:SMI1/KNR4 family protein n=1 Tax=Streptomyces sp. V4I23 TaxID=3042282 RepID=UPI002789A2F8|nr:SMI1/KNR4 family protein [Streptomyces sp. V4I23]MDQ1009509.1 hypothetical protein [Streptomyces sp. V4I23]
MDAADEEPRPGREALDTLRAAFPSEWREAPLGWDGVAAWETANGVVLPEPYRSFVAEIANGSALGPAEDGGLLPLDWLPPSWPDLGDRNVTAPFPLEAAWAWEYEEDAEGDIEERSNAVYNHGSIILGAEDGPMYWLLVVTGPQRGKIWLVADVGAHPYPGPDAAGFLEWVQRWQAGGTWWD